SPLRGSTKAPITEVSRYPLAIERQHGELGRRMPDEAVQEQEVFGLVGGQRVSCSLVGLTTARQPGVDLEPRPGSRREWTNGADSTVADEERLSPARFDRRSDQAELEPAQPLQAAEAVDHVLERVDAIPQPGRFLVAQVLGELRQACSQPRQRAILD